MFFVLQLDWIIIIQKVLNLMSQLTYLKELFSYILKANLAFKIVFSSHLFLNPHLNILSIYFVDNELAKVL